ncbi:hypothetical protein BS47DRAFT_1305414 [Hydnum rufescens UP504]|uniref:Fatty acid synthase type I helical domain-containing protein n=1 Tax=Hydnum rufescens UP504 TaxID=1448309 RepID=A0A9P6AIE0_9AGAM|nr:hypothetical protein BS47DRAFT_1305414 [Hydnum rufescens UP504]
MWYDILHGCISTVDCRITDKSLLEYMQYYVDCCNPGHGETYQLGKEFSQQLINNCQEALGEPPLYKDSACNLLLWVNKTNTARGFSDVPYRSSHGSDTCQAGQTLPLISKGMSF